jgi:hypothetical protein
VWGGVGPGGALQSGAIYDPSTDSWRGTAIMPPARSNHTAVWASTLTPTATMMIFGGLDSKGALSDGWIYTPGQTVSGDTWTQFQVMEGGAPTPRQLHTAVWDTTGNRMLVFGGTPPAGPAGDTFAYDPTTMGWTELSSPQGPAPRWNHTAVWDPVSSQMVVFGGTDGAAYFNDGAQFDGMNWTTITTAPDTREGHTAVVLSVNGTQQMVIFGGDQGVGNLLNTGGAWPIMKPAATTWSRLDTAPSARTHHTAVAITMPGTPPTLTSKMIVWGGDTAQGVTNTGAVLDASITSTN